MAVTHYFYYPEAALKNCCPNCGEDLQKVTFRETKYFVGIPIISTSEEDLHFECKSCKSIFELNKKVELFELRNKKLREETADSQILIIKKEIIGNTEFTTYQRNQEVKKTKNDKLMAITKIALMHYYIRENGLNLDEIDFNEIYSNYPEYMQEINKVREELAKLSNEQVEIYTFDLLEVAEKTFSRSTTVEILRPTAKISTIFAIGYNSVAKEILDFYKIGELNQKSFWLTLNKKL